eukprot:Em0003g465a
MRQQGTPFDDAYRSDVEPSTGHWNAETATEVKQRISGFLRDSMFRWIGITSGGMPVMRRQWNAKYQEMDYIACVYSTTSRGYCSQAKSDLIDYYEVKQRISGFLRDSMFRWIGITSGGMPVMRRQWNAKYQEMDYIACVYSTTSRGYCSQAKSDLIDYYGLKSEGGVLDNENTGAGGNLGSGDQYVVYLVWKNVEIEVKQRITGFLHGSNNRWIGITSAGEEGIRCRWNEKYRELGMKHIAWVYSTEDKQCCRDAERGLTRHFHLKSEADEEVVSSPDCICQQQQHHYSSLIPRPHMSQQQHHYSSLIPRPHMSQQQHHYSSLIPRPHVSQQQHHYSSLIPRPHMSQQQHHYSSLIPRPHMSQQQHHYSSLIPRPRMSQQQHHYSSLIPRPHMSQQQHHYSRTLDLAHRSKPLPHDAGMT